MTALKRIAIYGKNPTHPQLLVCMRCMHIVEESDNYCWDCGGEFTAGNSFVESFLTELKREAYFMGMNKLFEGIDAEFHSFIIDKEVGKILIKLKKEYEKE